MSTRYLELEPRRSTASRVFTALLSPEVVVLALLFALSLVLTWQYPEAIAEISIFG